NLLQKYLQAGLKETEAEERMPGESYITGSALSKQIKKAEEGFYREADSCVPKSGNRCYNLMAWDWTQETRMQAC
ncbi:Hypothetical protein SMAX5B_007563, partial [Scophthalmus maximus]